MAYSFCASVQVERMLCLRRLSQGGIRYVATALIISENVFSLVIPVQDPVTLAGSSVLSSREIGRAWNRLEMDRGQVIGSHKVVLVCAILYPCSWARFTWTCSGNLAGAIDLLLELRLSPGLADECPLTLRIPQNCKLPLWGTAQAALSLLHWMQGIFNRIGLTESEPYCISAQKCLIIASGA